MVYRRPAVPADRPGPLTPAGQPYSIMPRR